MPLRPSRIKKKKNALASANIRFQLTVYVISPQQCAGAYPSKIQQLYRCGVGMEGYHLFQEAGRRQEELVSNITEVPTVALDGVSEGRGRRMIPVLIKVDAFSQLMWIAIQSCFTWYSHFICC